jgi:hypothetical protein
MTTKKPRSFVFHALLIMTMGTGVMLAGAGAAHAETDAPPHPLRILDVGFRPLVSFPESLGLSVEVHPLGGRLSLEGGIGLSSIQSATVNAAVKYRFPVYVGDILALSVGPGVGSHWFFERGHGINAQLISAFAATEAIWWGNRFGFRLGLDLGAAYPIRDDPGNGNFGWSPVFNGSVGIAFRTDAGR